MLYIVVVGKDQASVDKFFADSPAVSKEISGCIVGIANGSPGTGLGKLGNIYLQRARVTGYSVFGLCHADCTFGPGALGIFEQTALSGKVAGIVGRDIRGGYRWANGAGIGPGPVSTLDCSCIFFRTDIGLCFDDLVFASHHCVVEDFCIQASYRGIESVVPAADASHRGESTQRPEWQKEYWHYRGLLERKWPGREFRTT